MFSAFGWQSPAALQLAHFAPHVGDLSTAAQQVAGEQLPAPPDPPDDAPLAPPVDAPPLEVPPPPLSFVVDDEHPRAAKTRRPKTRCAIRPKIPRRVRTMNCQDPPSAASQKSQSMSRGEHATGVGPLEGASEVFVPVPGEAVDARLQGARAVERTVA